MLRIENTKKIDIMDKNNAPVAWCEDGDTVVFETLDCADGAVSRDGVRDRTPGRYMANPATGPLYVRGAMPGDVLKVEILSLKNADWGFMGTGRHAQVFKHVDLDYDICVFDVSKGTVTVGGKTFPANPMVGVMGVAPEGEGINTMTPAAHGGNMDCTRVREGATVYFPVAVPGALLAMGDLHASMGDGEVFWYGLETAGEVTVRVSVIKEKKIHLPVVVDGKVLSVVASAATLDEASEIACEQLHEILVGNGWSPVEAGYLLSLRCNLVVCQIVNPAMTVRAEFPVELLWPEIG